MSVIVAETATTLATPNGFYRAEDYNIGHNSGTFLSLSTPQTIPATFAHGGNCRGVIIGPKNNIQNAITNRPLTTDLAQIMGTCTTSIGSPCVVTLAGHGFAGGEIIYLKTTGALPTGLTVNTNYYVKYIDLNTFHLALTPGGADINTSGSQSGTHTLYAVRGTQTLTNVQITAGNPADIGSWIIPFTWTAYPVDTSANKWVFRITQGAAGVGGTQNWSLLTSNGTAPFYITWCDTAVTFSTSNDCVVAIGQVTIDMTARFKPYQGTGETFGTCAIACRNPNPATATVCNFVWENPPAASYTLTLDGMMVLSQYAGLRIGSAGAGVIPYAKQANVVCLRTPTVGNAGQSGIYAVGELSYSNNGGMLVSLLCYGEVPVYFWDTLSAQAAAGQKVIVTTHATGWQPNDVLFIGKEHAQDVGDVTSYVIDTVVGQTITLTTNILGNYRKAGATVVNVSARFGVTIKTDPVNQYTSSNVKHFSNFTLSGCLIAGLRIGSVTNSSANATYGYDPTTANKSALVMQDSLNYGWVSGVPLFWFMTAPELGFTIDRCISVLGGFDAYPAFGYNTGGTYATYGGPFAVTNSRCVKPRGGYGLMDPLDASTMFGSYLDVENNVLENCASGYRGLVVTGYGAIVKNNYFYGCYATSALSLGTSGGLGCYFPQEISGNHYDYCGAAIAVYSALGVILKNEVFGAEEANAADLSVGWSGGVKAYHDVQFDNPTGLATPNLAYFYTATLGQGSMRFTTYNGTANDSRTYQKYGEIISTGSGLADTTVRTAGGLGMRLASNSGTNALTWRQTVPTGNIQNKTAAVYVWCNVNSANYYGGANYQLPRLTITYDNGSTAYAQATAATGWQLLLVPFTPLTTYGQITAQVSTRTDATGTNAYVYFDDYGVLFPPGVQLNLGSLDLWANGLPVMPTLATNLAAADVWAAATSALTGAGTVGKLLTDNVDAKISTAVGYLTLPSGTVVADGSNSALTFKTNRTEAADDYWRSVFVTFTTGALVGQTKVVTGYNGTTKFVTVGVAFTGTPAPGDAFIFVNR